MNNANTDLYDASVHRAVALRSYEENMSSKVSVNLTQHETKLDKLIGNHKGSKQALTAKIKTEIERTHTTNHSVTKRGLLELASNQVSYTYGNLEAIGGKIARILRPERSITETVLKKPLHSDMTLEQGWQGISVDERKRLSGVISKGLSEGLSQAEIAQSVRKGSVHAITRNQAKGLVVTATTSVAAQADQQVFEANSHILSGWQYIAVLDSRTTNLCASRDHKVFPLGDYAHLPPAHWHCRSTTSPVFKSWSMAASSDSVQHIRKRNLAGLSDKQKAYYDGNTALSESYQDWLTRQPVEVQMKHLGSDVKVNLFQKGNLTLDKYVNKVGDLLSIKQLRALDNSYIMEGDTVMFAHAKQKLDSLKLWATTPDDFIASKELQKTLKEYYELQGGDLEGLLSLTNYRGVLIGSKRSMRTRVLNNLPTEAQLIFNPVTRNYEDVRRYQPSFASIDSSRRLVNDSKVLTVADKEFITNFSETMRDSLGVNEAVAVTENLRVLFTRFRENPQAWGNFKAVSVSQMKFDVMNVSDMIETSIRSGSDVLKKLKLEGYTDSILGQTTLQELHDNFLPNIRAKNLWEDKVAPKIARDLHGLITRDIPLVVRARLSDRDLQQFYLRFAHRLGMADGPDRDSLALSLGRDLYNHANLNGSRETWYQAGLKILNSNRVSKYFKIETFGVQKKRMKSRMSGTYFGPYYDTISYNLRIVDPRILEYSNLTRKVELGLRTAVTSDKNKLVIRPGYKTYWTDRGVLGYEDTRIPITSTNSFKDFPDELVDDSLADAMNWAGEAKYRIDPEFYNFTQKLLYYQDDKGKAKFYDGLNEYKHYIGGRGDAYERFKSMEWLSKENTAFSNHAFVDHRARVYDRGMISPQSGETFRPYLNTEETKNFSKEAFDNFQDQIGAFLGGLSDKFEGPYNSLSMTGRQEVAKMWRPKMIELGNAMLRAKPADIRFILESDFAAGVEGEEFGKFYRFAMETAKIDKFLENNVRNFYLDDGLFYVSETPLDSLTLTPKVPYNYITSKGYENVKTPRVSVSETLQGALRKINSDIAGKRLYVYKVEGNPKTYSPTLAQTPNVTLTRELWIQEDVLVKKEGEIVIVPGKPKELEFGYDGGLTSTVKDWQFKPSRRDAYTPENLATLIDYKTALALEQDASSSGAQIIAMTTRNKELAAMSNVIPTTQKRRLYDEIAAATFDDPEFKTLNLKLGLTEKDLRKAAKAQNMVTFYGAGERTGILSVEGKLAKVLGKEQGTLVVKASDRDIVLDEISARAARYRFDPDTYAEYQALRKNVKDIFNKGLSIDDEIMEQLYFLDPKTKDLVRKMTSQYDRVITPQDFSNIAKIMSKHLSEKVPVLKGFTKFFGRLAEDYMKTAKPKNSAFDWKEVAKTQLLGTEKAGYKLPPIVSEVLGLKANEAVSEKMLKRWGPWQPKSTLHSILYGEAPPKYRRTGAKYLKVELFEVKKLFEFKLFTANKLPRAWTNVPWVNFDGKVIEQNFTAKFEERLHYKNENGNWVNNIVQVPQKTEATWWQQVINAEGKINDIADVSSARTAFAVNGNHSNDAVIVKRFHLWGKSKGLKTSTIHDAFFMNTVDMLAGRKALREIYATMLDSNVVFNTLTEMRNRGLPKELFDKYLNEAIDTGLIPVAGRSVIGGRVIIESDILKKSDILAPIPEGFSEDLGFYGVG
jgi:SPP1 gp7 family putative phage head morphogenesis protein